ncbi:MAG: BglG family transcription antiterminator [Lachnospiraceae bacterium]|nr:BglG family transcription antiterminator [Lachnospiraceae bacterium]
MITARLKQILLLLLKQDKPVTVQKLANAAGISKRTVQREMEYLPSEMADYHLEFQSRTGRGVWIEGSGEDKKAFAKYLRQSDSDGYMDREERRKHLTLELLKDKTPRKLFYFSNLFQVSEATVGNDLEAIELWFERYNLKILRKPGYGVCMEGSEKDYRRAMREFLQENMNSVLIRDFYEDTDFHEEIEKDQEQDIFKMLDREILLRVIDCVRDLDNNRLNHLTENSYTGLILHITIAINRILKGDLIEENPKLYQFVEKEEDFHVAGILAEALEEEFEVEIPKMEQAYICLHIQASKSQYMASGQLYQNSFKKEILSCIHDMIDAFDPEIAYRLKQDDEFIEGLMAHLQPTLIRLTNHMHIGNPVLPQIKAEYPEVFQKCLRVSKVLENYLKCEIPEEETGFFAIHFGAAQQRLENELQSRRQVQLGIVCASGIGISRLMLTRISRFLGDRVQITTWGKTDVTPYAAEGIDFFVSSIHFEFEGADILQVDPLLSDQDLERIDRKVKYYSHMPAKRVMENDFSRQLEQVNYMAVQIKSMVKDMQCIEMEKGISFENLLTVVSEKMTPYIDRRRIIQRDIMERERIASQIFPEMRFALLHARTAGVNKPNFSVCVPGGSRSFEHPYFKDVGAVIIMLMPKDEHMKENGDMLGYLSTCLIDDDEFLNIILKGEEESIRDKFNRLMRQYFNAYLEKL